MSGHYTKKFQSPKALVALLQSRGLEITDTARVESYLRRIGYYRLSGYWYPFLEEPKAKHIFKKNATFRKVLSLYHFDRKLRLLVFNEIEKIEVAVRCAMANIMADETGDLFWLTNPVYYHSAAKFRKTMSLIDKEYAHSTEDFIEHFRKNYSDPYPPAWMLVEILPFGILSRIYENINNFKARKRIADEFNLNIPVFLSWIIVLANTRNTCCHHGRLWNRRFALKTMSVKGAAPLTSLAVSPNRLFYRLCIVKYFVDIVSPSNDMAEHLSKLLKRYPMIDVAAMGFPTNWEQEPLWRVKRGCFQRFIDLLKRSIVADKHLFVAKMHIK